MAKGGVDEALKTDSSVKIKKEKGKKKPSDDDSIVGVETEAETVVIDGPHIQALSVKIEDLERIKTEIEERRKKMSSQSNIRTNKIIVRKLVEGDENSKKKTQNKKYTVARRKDVQEWPDEEHTGGIDFDSHGRIKEWSIIGTKEQYLKSALEAGDLDPRSGEVNRITKMLHKDEEETHSYYNHIRAAKIQHGTKFNESNALDNWRENMALRKKQQGYISNLITKPVEKLVSSGTEFYREKQEVRDLIDRAIPSIDYGKGYRVGSEFWRQYETIGDKNTGLKMSLKLSERGEHHDITRIGKSQLIKQEVGEDYTIERPKSQYLEMRTAELQGILQELEEHKPDYDSMVVTGNSFANDNTAVDDAPVSENESAEEAGSDQKEGPPKPLIQGPAVIVNGKIATTDKRSDGEVRITFDSVANEQCIQTLKISNCGTTVLFYDWSKVKYEKSFKAQRDDETQRFYFNASPGSILPGNTANIPFVFKSPNGGYFNEKWTLTARPALGKFDLTLAGNAALPDFTLKKRNEIKNRLASCEAHSAAFYVLESLMREVRTPERCPSPDSDYRTERDNFLRLNPGFFYHYDLVQLLKAQWREFVTGDYEWDLDLKVLRRRLFALDDFDAVEEQQSIMNDICRQLQSIPIPLPRVSNTDEIKRALSNGIDKICDQIIWLKNSWNILPTTPFPLMQRPTSSQTSVMSVKNAKEEKNVRKTPSGTRKANSGKGAKGGKEAKEDKNASKKKSKVAAGRDKVEPEPPKSSTALSNHSTEGMVDLNDPENAELRNALREKLKSMTKEVLLDTFDQISALLTND